MREFGPMVVGAATYVADLPCEGALHAVFVRSTVAHARVIGVEAPVGAVVLTAATLGLDPVKGFEAIADELARPPLASGTVRFVGEPIALVLAPSVAEATDIAELVTVDYQRLPAVVDPWDSDVVAFVAHQGSTEAEALADAEIVVRAHFEHPRLCAAPLETNAILASPQPDGTLLVHCSSQGVHTVRDAVARALRVSTDGVRVVAPYVGGGFGGKYHVCNEYLVVAAAARHAGRSVRWIETRNEHFLGPSHGRGQSQEVALGLTNDGRFTGYWARLRADGGAYAGLGAVMANATAVMATGPYRIPKVAVDADGALTNTAPTIAYRGAGRPEAAVALERVIDIAARQLGIDRSELRRRNLIEPHEFPYRTPTGLNYDSGNYQHALQIALDAIGYDRARTSTDRVRRGVGFAIYMDVTPFRLVTEYAGIRIDGDGDVQVRVGTCTFGQSHETTYATVIGAVLGVERDRVTLVDRDTALVPRGIGSASARSTQICGSAVHEAAVEVKRLAIERAAHLLEAPDTDVVLDGGRFSVRGVPSRSVGWIEVLREGAIDFEHDWTQPGNTFPFGVHAADVSVDTETGEITLDRFVAVDDCGRLVVPDIVDGQQQGGAMQGIAAALYEGIVYDRDGTPRSTSFADYLIPSAADVCRVDTYRTETPSPLNPIGAKGIGQSGCIGAPGAVINAVLDALAPLGVTELQPPLTPESVWRAIHRA